MPATIRDVAKYANVGIGTVSRVLNDSPAVREETRQKVLTTIKELDYTPNPIARQLSTGRTLTIGVILPYLTMPSYIERLRGVQHVLEDSEYDLVLFSAGNPSQRDAYFQNLSRKSRVDGMLIISLPPSDEQAERFANSSIPTVLIDAYHPKLCSVVVDDVEGGRIATRHLVELGHRKITYLSDYLNTPFHPSMRRRYQGYREILSEADIPYKPEYHIEVDRGRINARMMAKEILSLDDPPTAIYAASDTQAIGILDAAQELGVKIPEELSVIGYDNIRDAEYVNLTTIEQHLYNSGVEGAKMLIEILKGQLDTHCKQTIPLELIVRGTTAPAPN
ncbi:MAG: LacI family transcriptional regulator [Chloroflexi bacterium]|nr:LacI family transcriptional regulator [Chloroflexota bacterium]MBU1661255.1 LacI family transcriptional regulator [Chloroflexota bacterium]